MKKAGWSFVAEEVSVIVVCGLSAWLTIIEGILLLRFLGILSVTLSWYYYGGECFILFRKPQNGWRITRISSYFMLVSLTTLWHPVRDQFLATLCWPVLNHLAYFAGCYSEFNAVQTHGKGQSTHERSSIFIWLQLMIAFYALGSLFFLSSFALEESISPESRTVYAMISAAATAPFFILFPHLLYAALRDGYHRLVYRLWWTISSALSYYYLGLIHSHVYWDLLYHFQVMQTIMSLVFLCVSSFVAASAAVTASASIHLRKHSWESNHQTAHRGHDNLPSSIPLENATTASLSPFTTNMKSRHEKIMPRFAIDLVLVPVSPPLEHSS